MINTSPFATTSVRYQCHYCTFLAENANDLEIHQQVLHSSIVPKDVDHNVNNRVKRSLRYSEEDIDDPAEVDIYNYAQGIDETQKKTNRFKCNQCYNCFESLEELSAHSIEHSNKIPIVLRPLYY